MRFLHHFEGCASAQKHDVFHQRRSFLQQSVADELIEGIVAPDVFSGCDEVARTVEEPAGVQATGAAEPFLLTHESPRQTEKQVTHHRERVRKWSATPEHRFN